MRVILAQFSQQFFVFFLTVFFAYQLLLHGLQVVDGQNEFHFFSIDVVFFDLKQPFTDVKQFAQLFAGL